MTRSKLLNVALASASELSLAACAHGVPPPNISLDEPAATVAAVEPPKPVEIV